MECHRKWNTMFLFSTKRLLWRGLRPLMYAPPSRVRVNHRQMDGCVWLCGGASVSVCRCHINSLFRVFWRVRKSFGFHGLNNSVSSTRRLLNTLYHFFLRFKCKHRFVGKPKLQSKNPLRSDSSSFCPFHSFIYISKRIVRAFIVFITEHIGRQFTLFWWGSQDLNATDKTQPHLPKMWNCNNVQCHKPIFRPEGNWKNRFIIFMKNIYKFLKNNEEYNQEKD